MIRHSLIGEKSIQEALDRAIDSSGLEAIAREHKDIEKAAKILGEKCGVKITKHSLSLYLKNTIYGSFEGLLEYVNKK